MLIVREARSPWYIVAAVAFTASNRPEGVRRVFEDALEDLRSESATKSEEFLLAQKMREALFRSGLISGYNKVGFAFVLLYNERTHSARQLMVLKHYTKLCLKICRRRNSRGVSDILSSTRGTGVT